MAHEEGEDREARHGATAEDHHVLEGGPELKRLPETPNCHKLFQLIKIDANVLNYILFQSIFNKYTLHVLCTHFNLFDCPG